MISYFRKAPKPIIASVGFISAVVGIFGFFGMGFTQVVSFTQSIPTWAAFCVVSFISFVTGTVLGAFVQERYDARKVTRKIEQKQSSEQPAAGVARVSRLETSLAAANARIAELEKRPTREEMNAAVSEQEKHIEKLKASMETFLERMEETNRPSETELLRQKLEAGELSGIEAEVLRHVLELEGMQGMDMLMEVYDKGRAAYDDEWVESLDPYFDFRDLTHVDPTEKPEPEFGRERKVYVLNGGVREILDRHPFAFDRARQIKEFYAEMSHKSEIAYKRKISQSK